MWRFSFQKLHPRSLEIPARTAEETAKKLVERGLLAEAKEMGDGGGKDDAA